MQHEGYEPFVRDIRADGPTDISVNALLERTRREPLQRETRVVARRQPEERREAGEKRQRAAAKEPPVGRGASAEEAIAGGGEPKEQPRQPKDEGVDVKPPPAGAKVGYLRLNSKPWTRISIDGKDTGLTTPQTKISLPPGKHTITLVNNPFGIKHTFTVTIVAGETVTKVLDLRPPDQQEE